MGNFTEDMEAITQEQIDAAAMLMDAELFEDIASNYAPGFDDPAEFLAEYKRRHATTTEKNTMPNPRTLTAYVMVLLCAIALGHIGTKAIDNLAAYNVEQGQ